MVLTDEAQDYYTGTTFGNADWDADLVLWNTVHNDEGPFAHDVVVIDIAASVVFTDFDDVDGGVAIDGISVTDTPRPVTVAQLQNAFLAAISGRPRPDKVLIIHDGFVSMAANPLPLGPPVLDRLHGATTGPFVNRPNRLKVFEEWLADMGWPPGPRPDNDNELSSAPRQTVFMAASPREAWLLSVWLWVSRLVAAGQI